MKSSETNMAVNSDSGAAIFDVTHYGVTHYGPVSDLFEVA
jgi:electron transfer flavoprotein alpha subunit